VFLRVVEILSRAIVVLAIGIPLLLVTWFVDSVLAFRYQVVTPGLLVVSMVPLSRSESWLDWRIEAISFGADTICWFVVFTLIYALVSGRKTLLRKVVVPFSVVLALLTHGFIISRDPLAQGPSLAGVTLERNPFAAAPILVGLFREFPSQTSANPLTLCLSLLVDSMTWLVALFAASRLIRRLRGTKRSGESAAR
jgi:hypothetical protein